jgi:hypothetical protein
VWVIMRGTMQIILIRYSLWDDSFAGKKMPPTFRWPHTVCSFIKKFYQTENDYFFVYLYVTISQFHTCVPVNFHKVMQWW